MSSLEILKKEFEEKIATINKKYEAMYVEIDLQRQKLEEKEKVIVIQRSEEIKAVKDSFDQSLKDLLNYINVLIPSAKTNGVTLAPFNITTPVTIVTNQTPPVRPRSSHVIR